MTSVSDLSNLITAGVSVATALGGGIAFLWARLEYTNRKTQKALRQCERREMAGRERRAVQTTVIELLWQEIKRLSPTSAVLTRGRKLLDDLKHMDFDFDHDEDET